MPAGRLHLILPEPIADTAERGALHCALAESARLADADLTLHNPYHGDTGQPALPSSCEELPIPYRGKPMGRVLYSANGDSPAVARAASAISAVLEHALDREMAVGDLAGAMATSFEELSIIQSLLASIATRTEAAEIGELLVDEVAQTLTCKRVSLLVLDERKEHLKVLAARGLPSDVLGISVPTVGSVAGRTYLQDGLLVVDNIRNHPDLAALSHGNYESNSFAAIRVPLNARSEAIGVLAATERIGATEFTAGDCQLLEGMAAIGASALLNCRLHTTVNEQMMSAIRALATAVDAKDQYTHDHSARVAQLCLATARRIGITDSSANRDVYLAGLLHDIGKIGVPDMILSKPGRLTREEYEH